MESTVGAASSPSPCETVIEIDKPLLGVWLSKYLASFAWCVEHIPGVTPPSDHVDVTCIVDGEAAEVNFLSIHAHQAFNLRINTR
jgi:hypothetical protein